MAQFKHVQGPGIRIINIAVGTGGNNTAVYGLQNAFINGCLNHGSSQEIDGF
jgi:hypothetical protein